MSNVNTITSLHVEKLGHRIEEIRCRALENIISKVDHGFTCNCEGVKRELLSKLFNWFTFDTVPHPGRVLDLIHHLIVRKLVNLCAFDELRFKNELRQLHHRLGPSWHAKLEEIEEAAVRQLPEFAPDRGDPTENTTTTSGSTSSHDTTVQLDTSLPSEPGTPVSKKTDNSIRWLVMPWQPLVSSDRGVLSAVEEALTSPKDRSLIIHTCQLITNVMLQDFPAEVFLQRPAIVSIFQGFLKSPRDALVTAAVLRALHKLTRSLRFRIYYYCDPCIANKRQRVLLDTSCAPSERSGSENQPLDHVDESVLQLQQMLIPNYCTDTLINVLKLLSIPADNLRPLRDVKTMTDLCAELVELLNLSLMPSIWFCPDGLSLKIHEDLKTLMKLLGDVLEFLRSYSTVDHCRITYLQLLSVTAKLLSSLVPLEVSDCVLPGTLKISLAVALLDAPIYLMYPGLNATLQEYARHFCGADEVECLKLFDETRLVAKSMRSAVALLRRPHDASDVVSTMYISKSCLNYHKNYAILKRYVQALQGYNEFGAEDRALALKLILYLLANANDEVRVTMYEECHWLVSVALGVERTSGRYSWASVAFLFDPCLLTEIICHGVCDEERIKGFAEDILLLMLKGKVPMGEAGWSKFLEALLPVFPLLHCLAETKSPLGQCVSKMLDPDIYSDIHLTFLDVIKGNLRLMYSSDRPLREEAVFRLVYLLGMEKDAAAKRPRLASLHGLPLGSLFVFERQSTFKRPEGSYERSNLLSVLEMLKMQSVEPKVRKSALIQLSVMLTDTSLHKLFLAEKGLELVLNVLERSLHENDFENYPDSVIPIVLILKLVCSTQAAVRYDLAGSIDVFLNVLRSVFLFPNHESVKHDASQLLFILLFSEQMLRSDTNASVSLPDVVVRRMRVPFVCKSHWKSSIHRKSDTSVLHSSNPIALTFVRQFWAWEWNNGEDVLWLPWESVNDPDINDRLMIHEAELASLKFTSIRFYTQQQLFNIKNSTSHDEVACALDYLWMYVRFSELNNFDDIIGGFGKMPWEASFERFLLSHPASTEDCELFVDVLNFLNVLMIVTRDSRLVRWLSRTMRNTTKSLSDLLKSLDKNYQNIHQSVLKLVRSCTNLEKLDDSEEDESMGDFVEIVVANLCSNDQQHFYNLVYLDWLLTCLTYLTSNAKWRKIQGNKNLVTSLGTSLIELIVSFHGNGAISFMGLSITKNSIICLNHLLEHMESRVSFWYDNGRTINWLPTLWSNRDPLVRASALQLLAGLIRAPHTAQQLLHGLAVAPSELCQTLIRFLVNREESCIVREEAAIALSYLVKNASNPSFQYSDSLRSNAILIYVEQANVYYEVSLLCSNIYLSPTLDPTTDDELSNASEASTRSTSLPRSVLHYYHCQDELLMLPTRDSATDGPRFVTTPSLLTSVCGLLNSLIVVGEREVVNKLYENSLDKYFVSCFGAVPRVDASRDKAQYLDVVQMYTSICTVLTNCISHCEEFAGAVSFSPDFLYLLINYLKRDECPEERRCLSLRNRLWTEVFNFLSVLSLTEGQHMEAIRTAIELAGPELVMTAICGAIDDDDCELRMSAIACLAFLLSQEIQKDVEIKYGCNSLGAVLDCTLAKGKSPDDDKLQYVLNKLPTETRRTDVKESVGSRVCGALVHLLIAHNYATTKKKSKIARDKDLIVGALSNLLCVSAEAKRTALADNLGTTCLLILRELYAELNLQSYHAHRSNSEREKRVLPILLDVARVLVLLMNFAYDSRDVKCSVASAGVVDMLHKLWAWISLNDLALTATLKLIATLTTNCPEAGQSLTLTTTLPGAGPRKTPNTVSLLNVIVHLVSREIERAGQCFDNQRLHFAFHALRNAVHVHECRVAVSKSSLLQFLGRIHPAATKRNKPWPVVEVYCLEFLIDFTFYEEGQVAVPKAADGLEVLVHLARCTSPTTRILALSILRNLVFNASNRPRILASLDFMNLLHQTLKTGSFSEIGIAGSTLWSLVANNQKAKLMARSAGFAHTLQEVLGRLSLDKMPDEDQHRDLVKMIQYVAGLVRASDVSEAN